MSAPTNPERAYRLLMRAYPADFRAQFEREMTLLFRDQLRDSRVIGVRFWVRWYGTWRAARRHCASKHSTRGGTGTF